MTADLEQALADATTREREPLPREVAKARQQEQSHRGALTQSRALRALRALHEEEYKTLYERAKAQINATRGALPGDPDEG